MATESAGGGVGAKCGEEAAVLDPRLSLLYVLDLSHYSDPMTQVRDAPVGAERPRGREGRYGSSR